MHAPVVRGTAPDLILLLALHCCGIPMAADATCRPPVAPATWRQLSTKKSAATFVMPRGPRFEDNDAREAAQKV